MPDTLSALYGKLPSPCLTAAAGPSRQMMGRLRVGDATPDSLLEAISFVHT